MTRRERRKRRRTRRRAQIIAALSVILVAIVALRATYEPPEREETVIAAATPERETGVQTLSAKETPEREEIIAAVETEDEPVSRYSGLEVSDHDIEILASLVYHEARGESFEGQVAVIEVVLNRCISGYFPDAVEEVVFQKTGDTWQFSPAPYIWTAEPTEEQYNAVDTALHSTENILPLNTVFFSGAPYNDNIVATIGNHYFCAIEEEKTQ